MSFYRVGARETSGPRTIAVNGALAASQVAVTSLGYLIAYKIITASVGIGVVGAWSLCLALGSVSTIANLGVSDGLVRTVAQHAAARSPGGIRKVLVVGLTCSLVGGLLGASLCYLLAGAVLSLVIADQAMQATASFFVAPAIGVAVINTLGLACMGVLEGLERYGLRFAVGVAGMLMFVVAVTLFVPRFGVVGVVASYVAQAGVVFILAMTFCVLRTSKSSWNGENSVGHIVRDLMRIGLPMRANGLITYALDPLTRAATTYFGGATAAGHYELASRFVMQLRALIVAWFQAGLPRLVKLRATQDEEASRIEVDLFRASVIFSAAAFTVAALASPLIYVFVLGDIPPIGVAFFFLLCAGWCANAISAPYFFSLVAQRRVSAIWLSTGVMGLMNASLCWVFGAWGGAVGVVAALAVSVGTGSVITILARLKVSRVQSRFVRTPDLVLVAASVVALVVAYNPMFREPPQSPGPALLLSVSAVYLLVFAVVLFRSGVFRR